MSGSGDNQGHASPGGGRRLRPLRLALLVVVALGLSAAVYVYAQLFTPVSPGGAARVVDIKKGTPFRGILDEFAAQGLISGEEIFTALCVYKHIDRKVRPGRYEFPAGATPYDVFVKLRDAVVTVVPFVVREGETLNSMDSRLARLGLIEYGALGALSADREFLKQNSIPTPTLEGYIFPDTYYLDYGMSAGEIVAPMINKMREVLTPERLALAKKLRWGARELLTMASIVEKEAVAGSERPLISAVYHNRLRRGMLLQADPTVVYGIRELDDKITLADLRRKTPYNTYRIKGLPPGPIASPGLPSIEAALSPAKVKYLYFVSNNDGTHTFSSTYAEHARAVNKYRLKKKSAARKGIKPA